MTSPVNFKHMSSDGFILVCPLDREDDARGVIQLRHYV